MTTLGIGLYAVHLLVAGWSHATIALITTGHRHPRHSDRTERHGRLGCWRIFWEGEDVFFGHGSTSGVERQRMPVSHGTSIVVSSPATTRTSMSSHDMPASAVTT